MNNNKLWGIGFAAVVLAQFILVPVLPPVVTDVLVYSGINIILAASLNLVNGFTGQFSIGHAGFMAVGAYTSAYLSLLLRSQGLDLDTELLSQVVLLLTLVAGGIVSLIFGYIVGLPSLRLRGDYLAIVTLGFGEIIRVLILNMDFLGGPRGLSGIPQLSNFMSVYLWAVFTVLVIHRIVVSRQGRALVAVREDEIAATSMGVNTTQAKVRAFALGAFFAGVAGGLYAHYLTLLSPQAFDFNKSFEIIIMVVLGGMGSLTGSVVAAVLLTGLREYLRDLQELRMIIYSLILIGLMLTRPNGLFGKSEITDLWSRWRQRSRA